MAKKENNYYYDTFSKCISYACEAAELLQSCVDTYNASELRFITFVTAPSITPVPEEETNRTGLFV